MIRVSKKAFVLRRMVAYMLGIILCFTVLSRASAATASSQADRVIAVITLSADRAAIGEEITARYELSGGSGEYPRIACVWNIEDSATDCSYQKGSAKLTEASGEVTFTPNFGDSLCFQIEGEDSNGIPFLAHSEEIEITGEADYPKVTIALSSDSAAIGEEITARYEVSGGSGEYSSIYCVWNIEDSATHCGYQKGYTKLTETSGDISFTPLFGDTLYFQIEGEDRSGIPFLAHSEEIKITGEANYPKVTIALSSDSAAIGEEITARYEVSGGSGEYSRIYCVWNIEDSATDCSYQKGYTKLTETSGEVTFAPEFGDTLYFQIEGEDSSGIPFLAHSDEIVIYGAPIAVRRTLRIPSSMQIIESEAFRGVHVDMVYIPESVALIAADAFEPGVVLVLENDSLEEWAKANGIEYIVGFDNARS